MKTFFIKNKKELLLYLFVLLAFILLIFSATTFGWFKKAPYDQYLFQFNNISVTWYAIFIVSGILLASVVGYFEFKKLGWKTDILFDGLLFCVPLAIIGLRLYYVIFDSNGQYNNFWDIINITDGGLAITGALFTVFPFLIFFSKWKKVSFWTFVDIVAPSFFIGQIVGRWGNFMNQEAYGPIIKSNWLVNIIPNFIKDNMNIAGSYRHPMFLYEGLANFVGLVMLLVLRRKRILKTGDMLGLYLIWYGLVRGLLIEPFRTDPLYIFGLKVNVVFSLAILVTAGLAIIIGKKIFIKNQPYYYDLIVDKE